MDLFQLYDLITGAQQIPTGFIEIMVMGLLISIALLVKNSTVLAEVINDEGGIWPGLLKDDDGKWRKNWVFSIAMAVIIYLICQAKFGWIPALIPAAIFAVLGCRASLVAALGVLLVHLPGVSPLLGILASVVLCYAPLFLQETMPDDDDRIFYKKIAKIIFLPLVAVIGTVVLIWALFDLRNGYSLPLVTWVKMLMLLPPISLMFEGPVDFLTDKALWVKSKFRRS